MCCCRCHLVGSKSIRDSIFCNLFVPLKYYYVYIRISTICVSPDYLIYTRKLVQCHRAPNHCQIGKLSCMSALRRIHTRNVIKQIVNKTATVLKITTSLKLVFYNLSGKNSIICIYSLFYQQTWNANVLLWSLPQLEDQ